MTQSSIPNTPAPSLGPEQILQLARGFMEGKVLLAAATLGVFDQLEGGAESADVAAKIGGSVRGTEILLDALAAIGLIEKRGGRYFNRPECESLLRSDRDASFLGMLRHLNHVFRNWALLEDRITGKTPAPDESRAILDDPVANENFIRAMYAGGRQLAPMLCDALDLTGVRVAADLGGGPGHHLAEMARRSPLLEPWLVDLPLTLEVARKVQAGSDVASRLHYAEWNFYRDPAPGGLPAFDLVLVSAVLHAEGPEENVALLRKLAPLMASGGRVIVHENTVEEDRTRPKEAALFAINMLAGTPRGRTYTQEEIRAWGEAAGFSFVSGRRIGPRNCLVEMRKG